MKNRRKKILAGVLSASMLLGLAGCGSETKQADKNTAAEPSTEAATETVIGSSEEELSDLLNVSLNLDDALNGEKDETVYVMADAYGTR